MNIIGKKYLYFLISLLVVVPGLVSLLIYGLKPSIDFTGGSRSHLLFSKEVTKQQLKDINTIFREEKLDPHIQTSKKEIVIKTPVQNQNKHTKVIEKLEKLIGPPAGGFTEESFETVGPSVGSETTQKAVMAVIYSSILIVFYIAFSFRSVPKPASSFKFGICAIAALLHDVLVVVGIFSILGHFYGVEVDSLFVTAILTVIGFSVHDTIVVFDRIREMLRRMPTAGFSYVVNESILQTLGRSLNTSLTVLLVLFTMLLFGGESVRWFIIALLIGVASGTYSSIFNAAPLLVVWEEWTRKRNKN